MVPMQMRSRARADGHARPASAASAPGAIAGPDARAEAGIAGAAGAARDAPAPAARDAPAPAARDAPATVRFMLLVAAGLLGLVATYVVLVLTEPGQRLENLALLGAELRSDAQRARSLAYLAQISVVSIALAMALAFVLGIARGRPGLGALAGSIIGASVILAEILKEVLPRPELVTGAAWILRPSFPSGSAAAALAIAVGAILVVPDRLRWFALLVAALATVLVGEAIQVSGWHRLSDSIGAATLVLAVTGAALAILAGGRRVQPSSVGRVDRRLSGSIGVVAVIAVGIAGTMLSLLVVFPALAEQPAAGRAALQTAFPLLGSGVTLIALLAIARAIEPYTLGRGPRGAPDGRLVLSRSEAPGDRAPG